MNRMIFGHRAKIKRPHPCGEKSFGDFLKTKQCIYDNKNRVIFEGRGSFKGVVEQAIEQGVSLRNADLAGRNLKGVNFKGSDLSGVDFSSSNLKGSNLEGCNLYEAKAKKTIFKDAKMGTSNFQGISAVGAVFDGADVWCTGFQKANLENASFKDTKNVNAATFRSTNINGAKFDEGVAIKNEAYIERTSNRDVKTNVAVMNKVFSKDNSR